MTPMVPIAMFGWIPVALAIFVALPVRSAVVAAYVGAWLFLPVASYEAPGLPDYTKPIAASLGVLLGCLACAPGPLLRFRPRLVDAPMAAWCVAPLLASLSNGLGLYDGLSGMMSQVMIWGAPWLIGRAYLANEAGLKSLAAGVVAGGMIYIPLCLIEIRMSPQLHNWVYGYHQHLFSQTIRFGGYRPMVFMQHGLAVGMFMSAASLLGVWLWATGGMRRLWGLPIGLLVPALLLTTVLVKSVGALVLLVVGLGAIFATGAVRMRLALVVLALAPLGYIGARVAGDWSGRELVQAATYIDEGRAASLEGRMRYEELLADKAMQRPLFGWGGWGRSRIKNDEGEDATTVDGQWIIAMGKYGVFGLLAWLGAILTPIGRFCLRTPPQRWAEPAVAAATGLAFLLALSLIDNLVNAMFNPMFILAAGGLAGVEPMKRAAARRNRRRRQAAAARSGRRVGEEPAARKEAA